MTSIYSRLLYIDSAHTLNTFPFLLFPPFIHNGKLSHFVHREQRVQVSKNRPPPHLNISIGSDLKRKKEFGEVAYRSIGAAEMDRPEGTFFSSSSSVVIDAMSLRMSLAGRERERVLAAGLVCVFQPTITNKLVGSQRL